MIHVIPGFWSSTHGLKDTSQASATFPPTPPSSQTKRWPLTARQWWVGWTGLWRTWTTSRMLTPSWARSTLSKSMWILITSGYVTLSKPLFMHGSAEYSSVLMQLSIISLILASCWMHQCVRGSQVWPQSLQRWCPGGLAEVPGCGRRRPGQTVPLRLWRRRRAAATRASKTSHVVSRGCRQIPQNKNAQIKAFLFLWSFGENKIFIAFYIRGQMFNYNSLISTCGSRMQVIIHGALNDDK